ncbi:hypothetical protein [Streptomyces stelliscabiei]|uniref:MmyB family transcriptional regulator n=1 Tax=Streptomyces stelliscabiei TaxID=146820 RepID=UPI00131B588C
MAVPGAVACLSGDEFRTRWGAHDVRHHGTGTNASTTRPCDLTLASEGLEAAAEPGLTLTVHTAEPGSPSEEGLRLPACLGAARTAASGTEQPSGPR